MKKAIAIILIFIGLTMTILSIREYKGKNKHVDILGYELSLRNKKAKKIFYKNMTIGTIMIVGGGVLLAAGKRNRNKS